MTYFYLQICVLFNIKGIQKMKRRPIPKIWLEGGVCHPRDVARTVIKK